MNIETSNTPLLKRTLPLEIWALFLVLCILVTPVCGLIIALPALVTYLFLRVVG